MTRGNSNRYCSARKKNGARCRRPAGWGTDHVGIGTCKLHGGWLPGPRKAAAAQMARAELERTGMHVSLEVPPSELLLRVVHLTAGQLAHATAQVEQHSAAGEDGEPLERLKLEHWLHVQSDRQEAAARFAEVALRQGVEERRIRLAERQGAMIAQAVSDAIADLGLPDEYRTRFAQRVEARLLLLEQQTEDVEGSAA